MVLTESTLPAAALANSFTVDPATPYQLAFAAIPTTVIAGQLSSAISIQLEDPYGNLATSTSATTVTLTPTGMWYDSQGGLLANDQVTIPAGYSTADVYFKDTVTGQVSLTASATGITQSATGSITVHPQI